MNKAFVREAECEEEAAADAPPVARNYMTPQGYASLKTELEFLVTVERPELVKVVAWAAGNGDRSENGDYIYGKKRLREIDRRIRFLMKRVETAIVVDPARQECRDRVFFGATVTVAETGAAPRTYRIVGVDEADAGRGRISWISPLARALAKAREGDVVSLASPTGIRRIELLEIRYE
ncbi:MAG: transcription elongation factor GreB [Rhodocyclales bacterium CG_4_10_14_3_um_filter_68_10]|nr:MAG: transcription elongation factor GreB [Rhodocyclales bacterium CG_4_10_14_3_um_filter_68_10]